MKFEPTFSAILTLAFSSAAFIHFSGRIVRNWRRPEQKGRPAAIVSAVLALTVLGPIIVVGITGGYIPKRFFGAIETVTLVISSLLVFAIIHVEEKEKLRKQVARRELEDAETRARVAAEVAERSRSR